MKSGEWEELKKDKDSDQSIAEGLTSLHGGCVKPGSLVVVLLGKQWYWTVLLPQYYICYDIMTKKCPMGITYKAIAENPLLLLDESLAVKLPLGRLITFIICNSEGPVHEFKLRRLNSPDTFPLMSNTLDCPLSSVGDELQVLPEHKGARFYSLAFHELAQAEPEKRQRQSRNPYPTFSEGSAGCVSERILHADVSKEQAAWNMAEELWSMIPVGAVFDIVSAEEFAAWAGAKACGE